jgi:hypothetical protein
MELPLDAFDFDVPRQFPPIADRLFADLVR